MDRPVVSIVRTGPRPDAASVAAAVRRAITLAGGLQELVSPDDLVLIKPNLVAPPPSAAAGACTSALVCQAIADVVSGMGGRPVIAESSARGVDTEEVMGIMGFLALREQGYEVVDLKKTPTRQVPVPHGHVLQEVTIYELALQADLIVSVPVMKTHDQTDVTLSLKNLKGLVPDNEKRRIHQVGVFEGVSDLASLFPATYAVVDAVIAQEGLGPVYGLPVEMGLVLAGADMLAVDAVASRVMGFDPREIRLLRTAADRGLGMLDLGQIEVRGERIEEVERRFLRMEEDARLQSLEVRILHDEGTCTGCRNGVLSSLFDMIQAGTIEQARGVIIITGGALAPEGVSESLVVPVGVCCPASLRAHPNYVKGCPPNNVDIVRAIMAARP